MKIIGITATKGRHTHLEKLVGCFVNQDYVGDHTLLIYNNHEVEQQLWEGHLQLPSNKHIILINSPKHLQTGKDYTSLGEIYNDILFLISTLEDKYDIINHMDDDDTFLPNHFSEGVRGYLAGKVKAYKPAQSYYQDKNGLSLAQNVLEPSIFVSYEHVKHYGYHDRNVDLHHKWLKPLNDNGEIFVDPNGKPTFIYDWSGQIPTWKTSGDPGNPENFKNYASFSQDIGDKIITPS